MKICVTSVGSNLDSNMDPKFGRCKYFLIIDTESMNVESMLNDSIMTQGGAGIHAAQVVSKTGVDTVITGNIGPNAFQTLKAANIKVITGVNGKIRDIVNNFKKGEFKENDSHTVGNHFGMNYRGGV